MITERLNFRRIYDLTERVLPDRIDTNIPGEDELGQFFVRRTLSAYGAVQEKEIHEHIPAAGKEVISKSLFDLMDGGEVLSFKIEEDSKADYYALKENIEKSAKLKQIPPNVFLLSPFDNLIIQRERTKRLFGFDYVLECYHPPAKRKYGYFVIPILWGDSLVGRLDPKADRKNKTLIIHSILFEQGFKAFDNFLPSFADKLCDFARFNKCDKIIIEKISPAKIKTKLKRILKEAGFGDY